MLLCVFPCTFPSPSVYLTTGLVCCGAGLIGSLRTVWFAIAHFVHLYTNCRARTSPLTRVTVSRVAIYISIHKKRCGYIITISLNLFHLLINQTVSYDLIIQSQTRLPFQVSDIFYRLTTSFFITVVSTVIELITNPALRNTAAAGTGELMATAALVY